MRELMPVSGPAESSSARVWYKSKFRGEIRFAAPVAVTAKKASPTRPPAQPHSPLARRKWLKDQNVDC